MPSWPTLLRADAFAAMLNFEIADHPVYDGIELQWFDDDVHGTGMLVFLGRSDTHLIDYYVQPGLRLDRAGYQIGAGMGAWIETEFADAFLEIADDGVRASARFTDVDGRAIEVLVDDRNGRRRRRAGLLAPVSSAIKDPKSLFIVWLPSFDLVRTSGRPPVLRVDGADVTVGKLPGERLHGRHLIKYAAPIVTIEVLPDARPGALPPFSSPREGVVETTAAGATARLAFDPPLPDLAALPDGDRQDGSWSITASGQRLTGGRWFAGRDGDHVQAGLDVTEQWRPRGLPLLMRLVTTVVPLFRRWPTTYRWRASLDLREPAASEATDGWTRIGDATGDSYRKATGS
ncbi:hypothetical protein [Xylanimonas ulmi]|uniref:Uncharacterized protein n=1 Tax=Xylanimonas ulmi TaxID=228973 RepID=A0A4Q7LYZ7_9MICO|nr:hypothetical protein [Xylanibacterium ulmi]RZS60545.1 hypothetical protein EV386_0809 [Xylanibacterium ulmi]